MDDDKFRCRHWGAEVKISQVKGAEKSILRCSSMQHTVDPHHGGSVGGDRVINECPVPTRSSPHPSCDLVVGPFLTRDGVVVGGGF